MSQTGAGGVADLQEQRRFLLASLRDLEREREAGDIGEADYLRLRDDYTARAAAVLRQIERDQGPERHFGGGGQAEPSSGLKGGSHARLRAPVRAGARGRGGGESSSRPRARSAPQAQRRVSPGVYVAAVIATVIVGAGIGVVAFSTDEPVDGPAGGASAPASPIERQLAEGQRLEGEGKAAEALRAYDAVIRDDPENVQAHTYRGWLLARSTLVNEGLESLDKALALDPQYPVAHLFRGMVLHRYAQDPAGAIQEFETFLAANPPPNSVPAVRRMLDEARQALAQPPAPGPERPDQSGSQAPTGTGG